MHAKNRHNNGPTLIAEGRIKILFEQAEENFKENPELSNRYMLLAYKLATRHRVKFSRDQKMKFCKKCHAYLKQGINSSTRLVKGNIVLTCKSCGHVRRFVYKKSKR